MSIKEARDWFNNNNDPALAAMAENLLLLARERHGIDDVPPGVPQTVFESSRTEQTSLEDAMQRYRESWEANSLTPDVVNQTWQTFWRVNAEQAGMMSLEVPLCDRTTEELAALREQNRGVVLLPDEIMTLGGLRMLAYMFPNIMSTRLSRTSVLKQNENGGCVDVEMDIEAPHRNKTGQEMRSVFQDQGRTGQRLQTYIVASHFSKLLTGQHFDELQLTYSGLLGSTGSQGPLQAGMYGGNLSIFDFAVTRSEESAGFRSEGRKRV